MSAAALTFVVGPSSFSATQLCRLKDRSLQFTRTRLPNFSSNCFTSGSIPEKSSLWGRHNEKGTTLGSTLSAGNEGEELSFHLRVRVQSEKLQSGLTPHPGLDVSRALMRSKKSMSNQPWMLWTFYEKLIIFLCCFNFNFWKINLFVDLNAVVRQRQAESWESSGTGTHFTAASPSSATTSFHAHMVLLLRTSQCCSGAISRVSISGIFQKQMLWCSSPAGVTVGVGS